MSRNNSRNQSHNGGRPPSKRFERNASGPKSARPEAQRLAERALHRDRNRRPFVEPPATETMLAALAKLPTGATANQLAQAMSRMEGGRDFGIALKRLVEQGQVLETRPGRYQVSGTGGEFSAVVESAEADESAPGRLRARFPDGRVLPINPVYALGAKAGDVVQAMVGEDELALVTRILRRVGREVVGTILFRPGNTLLITDNRKDGQLPVLGAFPKFHDLYKAGDRVVGSIEVDEQGQAGVRLTRILGPETPEIADLRYVTLVHDLPGEFPKEVEAQAEAYREQLPLNRREDLRKKLVFTIDPKTAKDFDDAISLEPRPAGGWILGVHIADVSNYVVEQTPLDAEAALRGTSIYLINRVIPMLPEKLSNGLCSLVPNRDRYCLSAFLELDRAGQLVGTRLAETLICSRHRMTYEEALAVLEGRDEAGQWPDDLRQTLKNVSDIAQTLRKAREKAGALNLYSVERRFQLDVEGEPTEIGQEGTDISHQLIEECMLLANRAVAEWLETKKLPCIYRIHEEPDAERMKQFAMVLEAYGKDGSRVNNRFSLQKLLFDLGKEPPAARLVLNYLCLRSFKKAVYAIDNIGHYALAFRSYAHFTSPIRRYPDLLVHRLVKRGLALDGFRNVEIRRGYLDALAKQSSWLEQRAESAERDLDARKAARYLSTRIGETFPGVVVSATPGGLQVQMLETGMEAFLPMRELKDDFYSYDQERMCLLGRHSGRKIGVADEIDVIVAAVDIDRSDIVLGLPDAAASQRRDRRDEGRPAESKSQKPAPSGQKPETRNQKPEARSQKPQTGRQQRSDKIPRTDKIARHEKVRHERKKKRRR